MASKRFGNAGEEYLRSAHMEKKHIEETYRCMVDIEVHTTNQLGVWCVHFTARGPIVDQGMFAHLGTIKALFPNSGTQTLEGLFFASLVKLGALVSETRQRTGGVPIVA